MEEDGFCFSFYFYLVISSFLVIFLVKFVFLDLWWVPTRIEKHFKKQGIKSPRYEFFLGNLREISSLIMEASAQPISLSHHNILPRVLSFVHVWKKIYGTHPFLSPFFRDLYYFFFFFFTTQIEYFKI